VRNTTTESVIITIGEWRNRLAGCGAALL